MTVHLDDYGFILRKAGKEQIISYASIVSVRMSKSIDQVFKLQIQADGHHPLVISSQSFAENGSREDKSGAYTLFVRVLHHYLKDKSHANFTAGGNTDRIWKWAAVSAILSFMISITADYLGYSLINPYIQALVLAALAIIAILGFHAKRLPKTYPPTDIPIQFLP